MKVILLVILVTICSQVVYGYSGQIPGSTTSTTTAKSWTRKLKDGLGKFFEGAAIASAVHAGIQNGRGSKHKSLHQPNHKN